MAVEAKTKSDAKILDLQDVIRQTTQDLTNSEVYINNFFFPYVASHNTCTLKQKKLAFGIYFIIVSLEKSILGGV